MNKKITILPSTNTKISETLEHGSVFLALESKFFTAKELLEWLTTVPMSEATQIAYKAVCSKISPNDQYMDDSYHFYTKKPEYSLIGIKFHLDPEIPDKLNCQSDERNYISNHLCGQIFYWNANPECMKLADLIVSGNGGLSYIKSNLVTFYKARNFHYLSNMSAHDLNQNLVVCDWTDRFRYNVKLPLLIMDRVSYLYDKAPIYYANVAYGAYHKVALKLYKDRLLTTLSREQLLRFNSLFPGIIDTKILNYSDLGYKISLLGNDTAGYVLGYPIQNMIPNDDQIHNSIIDLTNIGIDKYCDKIKNYVKNTYLPILPFPSETKYANDKDVMMVDDIDDFGPFDIVAYQTGKHIYRFTRVEFHKLLETKKNHWTNDWLPSSVLSTINARYKASKELGLPQAKTLKSLLETLSETGKLYDDDDYDINGTHTNSQNDRSFMTYLTFRFIDPMNADFDGDEQINGPRPLEDEETNMDTSDLNSVD